MGMLSADGDAEVDRKTMRKESPLVPLQELRVRWGCPQGCGSVAGRAKRIHFTEVVPFGLGCYRLTRMRKPRSQVPSLAQEKRPENASTY